MISIFFKVKSYLIEKRNSEKQAQIEEVQKKQAKLNQKCGPWTIEELEDGGWENCYKKTVPPNSMSFPFEIDGSKDSEFQTNPQNLPGVFSFHNGKECAINKDRRVEDMDHSLPFYFINKTNKEVIFYIRIKKRSRY